MASRADDTLTWSSSQVDPDKAFAVQMAHEESVLSTSQAYMQCALLYTSSQGERRIRYSLPIPRWTAPLQLEGLGLRPLLAKTPFPCVWQMWEQAPSESKRRCSSLCATRH